MVGWYLSGHCCTELTLPFRTPRRCVSAHCASQLANGRVARQTSCVVVVQAACFYTGVCLCYDLKPFFPRAFGLQNNGVA